jgi:hypothetical protein
MISGIQSVFKEETGEDISREEVIKMSKKPK